MLGKSKRSVCQQFLHRRMKELPETKRMPNSICEHFGHARKGEVMKSFGLIVIDFVLSGNSPRLLMKLGKHLASTFMLRVIQFQRGASLNRSRLSRPASP